LYRITHSFNNTLTFIFYKLFDTRKYVMKNFWHKHRNEFGNRPGYLGCCYCAGNGDFPAAAGIVKSLAKAGIKGGMLLYEKGKE